MILATETFLGLKEGRDKAGYAIAPDGSKVRDILILFELLWSYLTWFVLNFYSFSQVIVYIKDFTRGENLAVYNVSSGTCHFLHVCDGRAQHAEFRCGMHCSHETFLTLD